MLTKYIQAAMRRAKYEIIEDDKSCFGHVPELKACGRTPRPWRRAGKNSRKFLEVWITFGIASHHSFPILDGIEITRFEPVEVA